MTQLQAQRHHSCRRSGVTVPRVPPPLPRAPPAQERHIYFFALPPWPVDGEAAAGERAEDGSLRTLAEVVSRCCCKQAGCAPWQRR